MAHPFELWWLVLALMLLLAVNIYLITKCPSRVAKLGLYIGAIYGSCLLTISLLCMFGIIS